MKNVSKENILRFRDGKDFSKQRHRHAIKLFLEEYPDDTLQQRSCQSHENNKATQSNFALLNNGMSDHENSSKL